MEVGTLAGAGGPLVGAPAAGEAGGAVVFAVALVFPADGGVVVVGGAGGDIEDARADAGDVGGGGGEFAFVLIVDLDGLADDINRLAAGDPGEVGRSEEFVVAGEGGEVVAVSVAVALGEHVDGVVGIEGAVGGGAAGLFLDVVVGGVDGFAGVDAVNVVPVEAVVGGGGGDAGAEEIVAATQEGEFFLDEGRDLALEGETGAVDLADGESAVDGDGGVVGVVGGLVAEDLVKVGEVAGGEEEGIVGGGIVVTGVDTEFFGAVEHGFVNLDEAEIVNVVQIQGDVALPAAAGLGEDADIGADGVVEEVVVALVEGVDAVEDAFDPALDQGGLHPTAPGGAGDVGGAGLGPVAHGEIVVAENEERVTERGGSGAADDHDVGEGAVRQDPG